MISSKRIQNAGKEKKLLYQVRMKCLIQIQIKEIQLTRCEVILEYFCFRFFFVVSMQFF